MPFSSSATAVLLNRVRHWEFGSVIIALFFIVGFVNIALGVCLAGWLGYGPATPSAFWATLGDQFTTIRTPAAPAPVLAPAIVPPDLSVMLDMEPDVEPDIGVFEQAYDDDTNDVLALLHPDVPENWNLDEKFVETSVLRLNIVMIKSGARNTEIDTRLRACRGNSDVETIRECRSLLREDCQSYLAEQTEAAEKLHARIDELGELRSLGEEIEMANLEQSAQVETTINNLANMDFESDIEAANLRLLQEIHNLRIARHRLRDSQEEAFLVIARYENRLDKIERQLFIDPLTRLRNRVGLETTLAGWWREGRHQSRQISAVLFDIDAFGKINETHGSVIGDKIVYHLAQYIQGAAGKADLVGRFAGQKFLMMMVDVGPRAAIKNAEMLRQSIEQITFNDGAGEIRLTVCSAVTEATPQDKYEDVLARLGEAMKAAKRAGANQAFDHDGRVAKVIESPGLGADATEIMI